MMHDFFANMGQVGKWGTMVLDNLTIDMMDLLRLDVAGEIARWIHTIYLLKIHNL